jgi:hypothetical protein
MRFSGRGSDDGSDESVDENRIAQMVRQHGF